MLKKLILGFVVAGLLCGTSFAECPYCSEENHTIQDVEERIAATEYVEEWCDNTHDTHTVLALLKISKSTEWINTRGGDECGTCDIHVAAMQHCCDYSYDEESYSEEDRDDGVASIYFANLYLLYSFVDTAYHYAEQAEGQFWLCNDHLKEANSAMEEAIEEADEALEHIPHPDV